MRRGRGQLFGGRAGGVSASFPRAPPRLRPALPPGAEAPGEGGLGGDPVFLRGVPAPCGVSRPSERQVCRDGAGDQRGTSRLRSRGAASSALLIAARVRLGTRDLRGIILTRGGGGACAHQHRGRLGSARRAAAACTVRTRDLRVLKKKKKKKIISLKLAGAGRR